MLSSMSAMAYAPTMAPVSTVARAAAPSMMDLAGLKEQATKLNPVVGYYDPLGLSEKEFWGSTEEARARVVGCLVGWEGAVEGVWALVVA